MNSKHCRLFFILLLSFTTIFECSELNVNALHPNSKPGLDYDDEIYVIKGKSVAIFPVQVTEAVPHEVKVKIENYILSYMNQLAVFGKIISKKALNHFFKVNGALSQKMEIYLDTFYNDSISDQELINPIAKGLKVDALLFIQIYFWPCRACLTDEILGMKLRLVDGYTGNIIWTGAHEVYDYDETDPDLQNGAMDMAQLLAEGFKDTFI